MHLALVLSALLWAGSSSAELQPLVCDPDLGGSTAGGMIGEFGFVADSFTACLTGPYWDVISGAYGEDDWSFLHALTFSSDGTSITAEAELELVLPGDVYGWVSTQGVASGELIAPPGPRAFQSIVVELERTGSVALVGVSLTGPSGALVLALNAEDLPTGVSEFPLDPLEPGATYRLNVTAGAFLEETGAGTARLVAAVDIPEPGGDAMLALGTLVLAAASRRGSAA